MKLECDMFAQSANLLRQHYLDRGWPAYPKHAPFLRMSSKQRKGTLRKILTVPSRGCFVVLNRTTCAAPTVEYDNPFSARKTREHLMSRNPSDKFIVCQVTKVDRNSPLNSIYLPAIYRVVSNREN